MLQSPCRRGQRGRRQSLDVVGKPPRELLGELKRTVLDVEVEIEVDLSGQPGPIPAGGHRPHRRRLIGVGLRNDETGEYHLYLTNIPRELLTADEIGLAYAQRWEVERLFAEMKGAYDLGTWPVATEEGVMAQTYATLIAWALSRKLRADILGEDTRSKIPGRRHSRRPFSGSRGSSQGTSAT